MSYEEAVAFIKARRPGAMPLPKLRETIEKVLKLRAHRVSKKARSSPTPRVA
jgi:hypothetical protein